MAMAFTPSLRTGNWVAVVEFCNSNSAFNSAFCILHSEFRMPLARISPLHRRRVERQRRDRINDRHHWAGGASRVERLEEAVADIARIDAIVGVAEAGSE